MNYPEMILLGIALGSDSFSLLVGIGMTGAGAVGPLKLSLIFSVPQAVLLVAGHQTVAALDRVFHRMALEPSTLYSQIHWVLSLAGAAVLFGLGVNNLAGLRHVPSRGRSRLRASFGVTSLALLALSVSIDALTAGLGLGMMDGPGIVRVGLLSGAVIWALAAVGIFAGLRLGTRAGPGVQVAGSLILIGLSIHFALELL
ncbi:MAG: manganese efflux pump [Firmicutes bacterium]|nr:manganese efflux pump [Bacillota bacterium]